VVLTHVHATSEFLARQFKNNKLFIYFIKKSKIKKRKEKGWQGCLDCSIGLGLNQEYFF
jgi:hypothetical protein